MQGVTQKGLREVKSFTVDGDNDISVLLPVRASYGAEKSQMFRRTSLETLKRIRDVVMSRARTDDFINDWEPGRRLPVIESELDDHFDEAEHEINRLFNDLETMYNATADKKTPELIEKSKTTYLSILTVMAMANDVMMYL